MASRVDIGLFRLFLWSGPKRTVEASLTSASLRQGYRALLWLAEAQGGLGWRKLLGQEADGRERQPGYPLNGFSPVLG